jgi:uncharacterized protein YndB with AHSA1/START domain
MAANSVERSIVVRCSRTTAFQVFTTQVDRWWPKSHLPGGDPMTTILIEPQLNGRLYERTAQGAEHTLGQIILWEPPERLAYHWYLGSGSERPSRVAITFTDLGDGRTRVDVAHRGPELIGELWARNSPIYASGWESVLAAYSTSIAEQKEESQ